jgi:hypothetical protein
MHGMSNIKPGIVPLTVKMEAAGFSETKLFMYRTISHHITEDSVTTAE